MDYKQYFYYTADKGLLQKEYVMSIYKRKQYIILNFGLRNLKLL